MALHWTSERMARLIELAAEDLSASQIAGEFGVTRNAVIGKLNRMGMKTGHAFYHPVDKAKREKPERRPRVREPKPLPTSEPVELPPDQSPHAIQFYKTKDHHCRWPLDDEPAYDMLVCGANKMEGVSYCVRHARIAFTKGRD